MATIRKLLIANRGEIASRIQRTAQGMGIATVAVFSDADRDAPFVKSADQAVHIGGSASAESYLNIERIVDAARRTGADALHPGFGFLAENAALAEACEAAGVIFVGPSADAIRAMGSKREAKARVSAAGVPVIPGGKADDQSVEGLVKEASTVGFPVLVKASAGGGGKGMRIVSSAAELAPAIESAKREAKSSFGDDTLLIEKYVERPRHVEIQILGDRHGNLVHLFERECSIQRRHQKIVEETPSPALTPELRARMGEAAVAAGRSVNYVSAGTVEFILDPRGQFYFLEVNTRLQVEHPITECVTGIDIVREQLLIAQGQALAFGQGELSMTGAAVECRLYAEDADNGFLPTTGTVVDYFVPEMPGLRVDSGIALGSDVGIHYDPMLAKVITHAPTRAEAIRKMVGALSRLSVQGVVTNARFLIRVLEHPEFAAGNTHTHFIDEHLRTPAEDKERPARVRRAAIAATLAARAQRLAAARPLPALGAGFRNNRFAAEWAEYELGEERLRVDYTPERDGSLSLRIGEVAATVRAHALDGPVVRFEDEAGVVHALRAVRAGERWHVHAFDGAVTLREVPRFPKHEAAIAAGACVAPMPGKVVKVAVEEGAHVSAGDVLVVLEAMKMEHSVKAPEDGVVKALLVSVEQQVDADAVLAVVSSSSDGAEGATD